MAANNLANTKAEIFASVVQRELTERATLVPLITDYSALAGKGMSTLSIPKLDQFTVQQRAFGTAASENAPLTDSADQLVLNKNRIVRFGVDKKDEIQSSIDYVINGLQRAATAHGRDVNNEIISALETSAGLNLANAGAITVDNILDMREFVLSNNGDMDQMALVIAYDQEKEMLKLPEFSRYEYRGIGREPVFSGMIGAVYGVNVILNTQLKAGQAIMVEKSGCGIAFQEGAQVDSNKNLAYGSGGVEYVVDQLFAVGGLQLGEKGLLATESPLIAKKIA